jgi:small-conductance mechanosensitive channel
MDLFDVVLFLLYVSFLWTTGMVIRVLIRDRLQKTRSKRIAKSRSKMVHYLFLVIGIFIGIRFFLDVSMDEVLTTLGIASLAIAYVSQKILQNVMAGFQINVEKKIEEEDWVELGKHNWRAPMKVVDIALTKTTLRDADGTEFSVPNLDINDSQFINYSKTGYAELDIELPLPLNADLEKLRSIIMPIFSSHPDTFPNVRFEPVLQASGIAPKMIKKILEKRPNVEKLAPYVQMTKVEEKYLVFVARCYVAQVSNISNIRSDLTWKIWEALREKGMTLQIAD